MRLRPIYHGDEPAVALEGSDGALLRVPGVDEIGVRTPLSRLRELAGDAVERLDPALVRARPVVPDPRRIICVGLNYRAHVEETPRELPTYPVLFT
jgi:acylpyruvate hydrolase